MVIIVGPGAAGIAAATVEAIDRSVCSEWTLDAEPCYRESWCRIQGRCMDRKIEAERMAKGA